MGVTIVCRSTGHAIWAIRYPFTLEMPYFYEIIFPRIGGRVKAEAIARISLAKNSPIDAFGKGLMAVFPKCCA